MNTLYLIGLFALLTQFTDCCDVLKITTESSELEYLNNARFKLNPTLLADGRPVYEEIRTDDQPKRIIHHYSHDGHSENEDERNDVDFENLDFYGRWIIGGSLYNGNGWAFLASWSIDPSLQLMKSYINSDIILDNEEYNKNQDSDQKETLQIKDKWNVFLNNEWRRASYEELSVICDDSNELDESELLFDWLFITFRNDTTVSWFRMNVTNDFNLNLHGFYYRITNNYYRKVDSNIFLEMLDDNNYRIFAYYGYTDANGIPLFNDIDEDTAGVIDPVQLITTFDDSSDETGLFPSSWTLVRNNSNNAESGTEDTLDTLMEDVRVEILYRKAENETIYDVMREYYNSKKQRSFHNSIETSLKNSGLIAKESSGMFAKYLGGASKELNENDLALVKKVESDMFVTLNNGMLFSLLGFGTGGLSGFDTNRRVIEDVINIGYRVIDSASAYDSENAIGDILYNFQNNESATLTRDDLYVTTKVWPTDLGFIETQSNLFESLDKLNTNYIDLYMIHWSRCMDHFSWMDCSQASGKSYLQTWQIMEKLYAEGRLLSLGVSNWDFNLWEQLSQANGCQIIPQVVQNYFDVAHQDWELLDYLASWGAVFQGYATYRGVSQADMRAESEPHYLEWRETLTNMANKKSEETGKTITAAQIMLRWLVESHVAVIPRSQTASHYEANWNVWGFNFTAEEHDKLSEKSLEEIRKRLKQEL